MIMLERTRYVVVYISIAIEMHVIIAMCIQQLSDPCGAVTVSSAELAEVSTRTK